MINCYNFSGTPYEIGLQHGETLKDSINELYLRLIKRHTDTIPSATERSIVGLTSRFIDSTQQYAPELVKEIEGISEGSGLAFEKIFFMNCYDEMSFYNDLVDQVNGCTLFLSTGRATADGRTYLGQGWDMNALFFPVIIKHSPTGSKDYSKIMLTHPGVIGGAGINEHGLSLVWSTLKAVDEKTGLPVPLMIRKVLNGKNLNDAVHVLLNTPRASGFNFMVANEYGGFNIEATGMQERICYVTSISAHANHYEDDLLRQYEIKPRIRRSNTHIRSGRMKQLLENKFGNINLEYCKEILCDHANYPYSICRHLVAGESDSVTQSALIFIPEEKVILASDGPACESGFDLFSLDG